LVYLLVQVALGIFCKLHVYEDSVRPYLARLHSWLGKLFPFISWTQILFGFLTAHGLCFGSHLGQCLAHHIMGSAFQMYAVVSLLMLRYGAGWLAMRNQSQEYLDSWVVSHLLASIRELTFTRS
jgi:hypothetical protein